MEPGEAVEPGAAVVADSTRHPVLVIEEDPATRDIPVIICTSKILDEEEKDALPGQDTRPWRPPTAGMR